VAASSGESPPQTLADLTGADTAVAEDGGLAIVDDVVLTQPQIESLTR
jgi:hypothetical protein